MHSTAMWKRPRGSNPTVQLVLLLIAAVWKIPTLQLQLENHAGCLKIAKQHEEKKLRVDLFIDQWNATSR